MKFDNIKNYKQNWIVGDFKPSLFESTSIDIGILYCKKNDTGDFHYHLKHTEYNVIISGSVMVNKNKLSIGDIFIFEPMDKSDLLFLEDTVLLVIKNPSIKNDKYYE